MESVNPLYEEDKSFKMTYAFEYSKKKDLQPDEKMKYLKIAGDNKHVNAILKIARINC